MTDAPIRPDPSKLAELLAVHEAMIRARQQRIALVVEEEAAAQATIERCRVERLKIGDELGAFIKTLGLLQTDLGLPSVDQPSLGYEAAPRPVLTLVPSGDVQSENERKLKARIGDQRYLMLSALRAEAMTPDALVDATGLNAKRVKDQMVTDMAHGVVLRDMRDGRLRVTPRGLDLLERFENHKRDKGQPLPSLHDPRDSDDGEEADSETQNEGSNG